MIYKYQYGVFIVVERKKDLQPLLDTLSEVSIDRKLNSYDFLPSFRTPLKLSEYRILKSEVKF